MVISYEKGKARPNSLFLSRLAANAGISESDLENKKLKEEDIKIVGSKKEEARKNVVRENEQVLAESQSIYAAGTIPAREYIEMLKQHNAFLERNFEISLKAIRGAQVETGSQLKALTWYATQVANKGDQSKADQDLLGIYSKIASYEGLEDEDDNSETGDSKRTSAKRKL